MINLLKHRLESKQVIATNTSLYKSLEDSTVAVIYIYNNGESQEIDPKLVGNYKDEVRIYFKCNFEQKEFSKSINDGITKDQLELIHTFLKDNINNPVIVFAHNEKLGSLIKDLGYISKDKKVFVKSNYNLYKLVTEEFENLI